MERSILIEYIQLLVEKQVKQAYLSGGRSCDWGSSEHISDLENRMMDAAYWRDKYPKGSEKRGHYRNVYKHLKTELQSARKKNQITEKQRK